MVSAWKWGEANMLGFWSPMPTRIGCRQECDQSERGERADGELGLGVQRDQVLSSFICCNGRGP